MGDRRIGPHELGTDDEPPLHTVAAERVLRAAELKRWSVAEAARAAGVKAEADGIVFE